MSDPKESLADRLVEAMRTPADPAAEAERDAFEAKKAEELRVAMAAWRAKPPEPRAAAAPPVPAPPPAASIAAYQRVLAAPSSLAARKDLAAVWRAEHDSRAELVDNQLRLREHRLAGTVSSDEANALYRQIHVLVRDHGARWAGELARHVEGYEFHRGCIAEVTLEGRAFAKEMPPLLRHAPIQHVNLVPPLALDEVAQSPYLAKLSSLSIIELRDAFGDREAATLAASPHVDNLRWLRLYDNSIGRPGIEALAASPHLARCIYIGLGGNPVDVTPTVSSYEGIETRARSTYAEELEHTFGSRPWLAVPAEGVDWPPHRDDISTTD